MIRINNPHGLCTRPDCVALCELAIGAGIAGHGLTIGFAGFPAVVLAEVYGHCLRGIGAATLIRVGGQRDLKTLEERADSIRLVLIESERLLAKAQWSIQFASAASRQSSPMPSVLCSSAPSNSEELPGTTMVLQRTELEVAAIRQWLGDAACVNPTSVQFEMPTSVAVAPNVLSAIAQFERAAMLPPDRRIMNERILMGLLAGASVIRSAEHGMSGPAIVTSDDYRLVRALVQRSLIRSADIECDPLAADMVNRANIYLSIKFGRDTSPDNPLRASEEAYLRLERTAGQTNLVTRREIANLGNTSSGLVRDLLTSLQRMNGGYGQFRSLGLVKHPPTERVWSRARPAELARYLKSWSIKQVRTHFEALQRGGLVTGEREHNNGAWRYELPEALAMNGSAFASLPVIEG